MIKPKLLAALAIFATLTPVRADAQRASTRHRTVRPDVPELPLEQRAIHVLNRLTFGPRPGDAEKVLAMGLDQWLDIQLHPDRINDEGLETFLSKYPLINRSGAELLEGYAAGVREVQAVLRTGPDSIRGIARSDSILRSQGKERSEVIQEIRSARVARAVASSRQLLEVLTDFWENHFSVYSLKTGVEPYYLAGFDDTIRQHALGKFRDLLEAVAKSPAMLVYLDNTNSMVDGTRPTLDGAGIVHAPSGRPRQGLNENYGRELLELHTLGVDGGYTQQDVIDVARAFTGWTVKPAAQGGAFTFRPQLHDAGPKVVLGHRLAAGRGIEDGEDVLDIVARSPSTARFISWKLARHFVSDSPSKALVDHAAKVYLDTDGDIREVLRAIVTSPEFYSRQAFRSKVKTPLEVVVSTARALNAPPDSTGATAQLVEYLGEPIFGHLAPDGWPDTGDAWINTGSILNRINFGISVASGRLPGVNIDKVASLNPVRTAPHDKQVDAVVSMILSGIVSPDTRAVLLSGNQPLVAPSAAAPVDKLAGLPQIVGLAIGSPEFQRH